MRVSLFAGLAALGAAVDSSFDDEDLNFLRLLSSNASNQTQSSAPSTTAMNTAAPTTQAPANTTAAPANTTAAPATTTAAATTVAANTTAAPGETTAAPGETTAAPGETTAAPGETTAAQGETTQAQGEMTTSAPPQLVDQLCSAENYAALNLNLPANVITGTAFPANDALKTDPLMAMCSASLDGKTEATAWWTWGAESHSTANKKRCTDAGGTVTEKTCKTLTAADVTSSNNDWGTGALVYCCQNAKDLGAVAGWPRSFFLGAPQSGGEFKVGWYTDAECSTVFAGLTAEEHFEDFTRFGGASAEKKWQASTCIQVTQGRGDVAGTYHKVDAWNTTKYIRSFSVDSSCAHVLYTEMKDNSASCTALPERRQLVNHTSGGGGEGPTHEYDGISGGDAIEDLAISTEVAVSFSNLPDSVKAGSTQSETIRESTCGAVLTEAKKAATGDGVTTVVDSCFGSGKLSAVPASSRRRLAARRLVGHTSPDKVDTVLRTTVPVAQATALKQTMATAATPGGTGALEPAALMTAVIDKVKADSPDLGGNITASVAPVVVNDPVIYIAPGGGGGGGGGGSTSGAVVEYLSYGVGLITAAALVF